MGIVTQKEEKIYGHGGVCTMQPSNVSIQQEKMMMGPREEDDGPTSLCFKPLNVSIQQKKNMAGPLHCACSL